MITYPSEEAQEEEEEVVEGNDTNSEPSSSILQLPETETCFDGVNN